MAASESVATIGGGMNSFLENYAGRDREIARIATYRLWLGVTPQTIKCLTHAGGDGPWGELGDAYFLATGSKENILAAFGARCLPYGKPRLRRLRGPLPPLTQ